MAQKYNKFGTKQNDLKKSFENGENYYSITQVFISTRHILVFIHVRLLVFSHVEILVFTAVHLLVFISKNNSFLWLHLYIVSS